MPNQIDINAFAGMSNVSPVFFAEEGVLSPRMVLNADVDASGGITKRSGQTLYLALAGAHSLRAFDSCMLCAASGKLYNVGGGVATQLAAISGPTSEPLSYELCENKVYISNSYWRGIYDPATNTVSDWGLALPPGPMLLSASGELSAGTYHVCFTALSGGQLSGNGPISTIKLNSTGGISILNRPSSALVWATDVNDHIFSLVGPADRIDNLPNIEPLPNFMCGPPPNMTCLTYAFGRMWGAYEQEVYYSEPHQVGWFKITSNRFKFNFEVNTIAKVSSGLFIGMKEKTVFLRGTEPDQMEQMDAGGGSIKGTLEYCNNVPYLADIMGLPEKVFSDVPVWRTVDGIVAGNSTGRLFNLTRDKLKLGIPERGASLYRTKDGVFQFLTSAAMGSAGSGRGAFDQRLRDAVASGRIPTINKSGNIQTSQAACLDEATIEVRRNGVIVPAL